MKLGKEVNLSDLAIELVAARLQQQLLDNAAINPTQAMMILAARLISELPRLEDADGKSSTMGWLIAEHLQLESDLTIFATATSVELRMGDERVSESLLRQLLDFDQFVAIHGEWWGESDPAEAVYNLSNGRRIKIEGDDNSWDRYNPQRSS